MKEGNKDMSIMHTYSAIKLPWGHFSR